MGTPAAMGGYPELERGSGHGRGLAWRADATGFQSARAAIAALLRQRRATTVWMPHHVCRAAVEAVMHAGAEVRQYPLADDMGPPDALEPAIGEWVLCVDYFGFSTRGVDRALARFDPERVLVDASLALFRPPAAGAATVYSPRKFVGVPDGGWLVAPGIPPPRLPADESGSRGRCKHLLHRRAGDAEAGYPYFVAAEASLGDDSPREMSRLTSRLLARIDFDAVAARRIRNHAALASALSAHGLGTLPLPASAVPQHCLLVGVDAPRLRERLIGRRIYTPCYWPEGALPPGDSVAQALRERTLYLPCDQRYGEQDMQRLASVVADVAGMA